MFYINIYEWLAMEVATTAEAAAAAARPMMISYIVGNHSAAQFPSFE